MVITNDRKVFVCDFKAHRIQHIYQHIVVRKCQKIGARQIGKRLWMSDSGEVAVCGIKKSLVVTDFFGDQVRLR